ncbi:unnamed protein product, partial [Rotaria socialis]
PTSPTYSPQSPPCPLGEYVGDVGP